ncbi:MAG: flippase [Candidatus Omnitrophica bacterium]|nr:flippase [Candidatus Omnitrophota bacterium]
MFRKLHGKSMLHNFSSLIMANLAYKVLSFVMLIVIARFLGVREFGKLSYGLSFVWIFLFLADMGLHDSFVRDVSRDRTLFNKYVNNIFALKIVIGAINYLLIVLIAFFAPSLKANFFLILILGASVISDSFVYFFRMIFRIAETMHYEAVLMVVEAIIKISAVLLLINLRPFGGRVTVVAAALLGASLINFALNLAVFLFNCRSLELSADWRFWMKLLKTAYPFTLIALLGLLNFRVDILFLSIKRGDFETGLFSADFRLVEQLLLIPITFSAAVLPVFSRLSRSQEEFKRTVKKIFYPYIITGISLTIMLYLFARQIIAAIYGGQYIYATQSLNLLALVLVPFFIKILLEKILLSLGRQGIVCLIYLGGSVMNIALNSILTQRFGVSGAAFSTFASEACVVIFCLFISRRAMGVSLFYPEQLDIEQNAVIKEMSY